VRWYLRYALSYRDLEETIAERGMEVDHVNRSIFLQTWRRLSHLGGALSARLRLWNTPIDGYLNLGTVLRV
jgi:hypothetical protein